MVERAGMQTEMTGCDSSIQIHGNMQNHKKRITKNKNQEREKPRATKSYDPPPRIAKTKPTLSAISNFSKYSQSRPPPAASYRARIHVFQELWNGMKQRYGNDSCSSG